MVNNLFKNKADEIKNKSIDEYRNADLLDPTDLKAVYNVVPVNPTAGAGLTKNIMVLGDSIVANGNITKHLRDLFNTDVMDVNFIGTLNTYGDDVPNHEGRGGWTAWHYTHVGEYNDNVNAFWDGTKFNFSNYMETNNFDGIDVVVINLGINDSLNDAYLARLIDDYNIIINSIREYNSQCAIIINLPLLPACYEVHNTISSDTDFMKTRRLEVWIKLIKEYDLKQDNKIFVAPVGAMIDVENDYPYEMINLSSIHI